MPRFGRQPGGNDQCLPDTIPQPGGPPLMTTSSKEPTLTESDPPTGDKHSLSTSHEPAQSSRTGSPTDASASSSSTAVHQYYERVQPTWTIRRYDRNTKLKPPYIGRRLAPMTTSFSDGGEPGNWARLVHPEGALYWVYMHQYDKTMMPVYTDAYLYDERIRKDVEMFRDAILSHIDAQLMPPEWELVLDLNDEDDPNDCTCSYYFVNCSNRTLFWVHEFDVWPLLYGIYNIKSRRHIQQAMESFYWGHWEMFPHKRKVPDALLQELIGIMIHAGLDEMTSHESTSVYSGDEMEKFISYVERVKSVGESHGYSACVVGRLMRFFTQGRYINFFGQREARLSTTQSIFDDEHRKKRTWLIKSTSVLLFFAPEVHLKALDNVYTDYVVCQHKWTKFIQKTQNEWRELVRIATVLLTANVAFLAIPSVDTLTNGTTESGSGITAYTRSSAQVTSYMSVIFSMGCMVAGQLLLRHHMIRPRESAEQVDKYLRSYLDTHRGLEILAILYSLPQALLLWAIASFFVAFIFVALVASKGKWQRYPTVAVMVIFLALVIWCTWATWAGRDGSLQRVFNSLKRLVTTNRGRSAHLSNAGQLSQQANQNSTSFQSIHVRA